MAWYQVFHPTFTLSHPVHWTCSFVCHLNSTESIVLQPFRCIELIIHTAISALPGTHFHLSQVTHLRVKYLAQGHNIETLKGEKNMIFLWISCTKRDSKSHDRQRYCQSSALYPANTKLLYNICTTSAQRLRRWSNIVQMFYKCFVFTE